MITNQQFKKLQAEIDAAQMHIESAKSMLVTLSQQTDIVTNTTRVYPNRPMFKSELAAMLGKSTRQLSKWISPFRPHLRELGVKDRAKILPADAVFYICSELDITSHEKNDGVNRIKPN